MAVCWRPAVPAFLGQLPSIPAARSHRVSTSARPPRARPPGTAAANTISRSIRATGSTGSAWDLWSITGGVSASGTFTISAITESSNGVLGQMANFNNANTYQWLLASSSTAMPSNLLSFLALDGSGFQNALAGTGHIFLSESADDLSLYLNYSPTGGNGHAFVMGGSGSSSAAMGNPVPEPGTLALLAAGLAGLLAYIWQKRR